MTGLTVNSVFIVLMLMFRLTTPKIEHGMGNVFMSVLALGIYKI